MTLLLMQLFLGPSVGASPSSEEFVIEAIQENEEITGIQEAAPVRPLPASKLIEMVQGSRKLVWAGVLRPHHDQWLTLQQGHADGGPSHPPLWHQGASHQSEQWPQRCGADQ